MKPFADRIVERVKKYFLCSITSCFNRAVYEIRRKNEVEPNRAQMTRWRMRIACWIPKAKNTHKTWNGYCFCIERKISRTQLNVILYVQCLSCWHCSYRNC